MKMLRLFLMLTLLCGVIYPMAVTIVSQTFFADKANGSLVVKNGQLIGSSLLAQKFERQDFFHPRPSAADYATIPSGASNNSVEKIKQNHKAGRESTSASGLDPHISPEMAFAQVSRVAAARGQSEVSLEKLIKAHIEGETLGIWGRPRVNVLELNISLSEQENHGKSGSTP
jgi:K+-transporting ATPase ATPase C chain